MAKSARSSGGGGSGVLLQQAVRGAIEHANGRVMYEIEVPAAATSGIGPGQSPPAPWRQNTRRTHLLRGQLRLVEQREGRGERRAGRRKKASAVRLGRAQGNEESTGPTDAQHGGEKSTKVKGNTPAV